MRLRCYLLDLADLGERTPDKVLRDVYAAYKIVGQLDYAEESTAGRSHQDRRAVSDCSPEDLNNE